MEDPSAAAANESPLAVPFRRIGVSLAGTFSWLALYLELFAAELRPTRGRWRRAARLAALSAFGAALMSAVQIANPLGLTLLFNFGAPEAAFGLSSAMLFLAGAAIAQFAAISIAGAMTALPSAHFVAFVIVTIVSSYLIYARLGRLWVWVQIPVVTAFYMSLFENAQPARDDGGMFAGLMLTVAIIFVVNSTLWPVSAEATLTESLAAAIAESRRRLALLAQLLLPQDDRVPADRRVASQLGNHLTTLAPILRNQISSPRAGSLLSAVMVAERLHHNVERIASIAADPTFKMPDQLQAYVRDAIATLDSAIGRYQAALTGGVLGETAANPDAHTHPMIGEPGAPAPDPASAELLAHLRATLALVKPSPAESAIDLTPFPSARPTRHALRANPFLVRFSLRHSTAMAIAFVAGLADYNPALRAALWLLMIGGPPSHGATIRKFLTRAIGAAAALGFAALCTILLAPNFSSPVAYAAVILPVIMLVAYVAEGGGLMSYLGIGGTAFLIAFSAPAPRVDVFASIWTIWGISFGMVIRAAMSLLWRERASRTLTEQFQQPLTSAAIVMRNGAGLAAGNPADKVAIADSHRRILRSVAELLTIANDAQLEGASAGIDAAELVNSLDTFNRIVAIGARLALSENSPRLLAAPALAPLLDAIAHRLEAWADHLRREDAIGSRSRAPLREMVDQARRLATPAALRSQPDDAIASRLADLADALETHLRRVSLF